MTAPFKPTEKSAIASLTAPRRPILVLLHQGRSSPGRIGQFFETRGHRLDIRRPALGEGLPEDVTGYAGVVIFGGPMSANDKDAFIIKEIEFIKRPLAAGVPFLGVCLGAQMLAKLAGGRVRPHPDGLTEIGYYRLYPTPEGARLMDWPRNVYQWHKEGLEAPASAEILARGDLFDHQAFRLGARAYGIQFHAELTLAMLHRWTTMGAPRFALPGAQPRRDHFAGRAIFEPAVKAWLSRFLDLWLASGIKTSSPAPAALSPNQAAV